MSWRRIWMINSDTVSADQNVKIGKSMESRYARHRLLTMLETRPRHTPYAILLVPRRLVPNFLYLLS